MDCCSDLSNPDQYLSFQFEILNVFLCVILYVQGQPLGFDTKYLVLADRNKQVRFDLKVVRES